MGRRIVLIFSVFMFLILSFYFFNKDKSQTADFSSQESEEKSSSSEAVKARSQAVAEKDSTLAVQNEKPKKGIRVFYSIEDLQKEYGPGWKLLKSPRDANFVKSILVSQTQAPRLSVNNVSSFVGSLRPLLGVPQAQVVLLSNENNPHQFDLVQKIKGYEVYGGRLRIVTDPENSTPVIINNELRPIVKLNEEILFTSQAAEELIQREYIRDNQVLAFSVQAKPVVFSRSGQLGELTWIVHAEWTETKALKAKDFLVSAVDGTVLFTRDLVFH